jgi:ribosomal protein L24E
MRFVIQCFCLMIFIFDLSEDFWISLSLSFQFMLLLFLSFGMIFGDVISVLVCKIAEKKIQCYFCNVQMKNDSGCLYQRYDTFTYSIYPREIKWTFKIHIKLSMQHYISLDMDFWDRITVFLNSVRWGWTF